MRTLLMQAAGAASMAYTATHLMYGDAQYADFGVVNLDSAVLLKWLPILAGALYPLIAAKWPAMAHIVKLILDVLKYKSPVTADMLSKVSALEAHFTHEGDPAMQSACAAMRSELLK